MLKQFEINDCGVVTNPNTPFFSQMPKSLAWDYWSIKTGICSNGLWDYGKHYAGGGGPVSIGIFNTENEAIKQAIQELNVLFLERLDGTSITTAASVQYNYKKFLQFVSAFQSQNLQIQNLLNQPIQLTMF